MLKPRKRLVKAQLKEDKLLTFTAKVQSYIDSYWKHAAIAVAAVVVLMFSITFIQSSGKSTEAKAGLEELLARDAYSRGEMDETLRRINVILDDYSGTSTVPTALMLKGRIYEQRGEFAQAEEVYNTIVRKHSNSPYIAHAAYIGLASIEFGRGENAKAASYYEDAAMKFQDHFNAPNALVQAGECLSKISRYEEAKRIYSIVLKQYPKSRSANSARSNLAELEFMD